MGPFAQMLPGPGPGTTEGCGKVGSPQALPESPGCPPIGR